MTRARSSRRGMTQGLESVAARPRAGRESTWIKIASLSARKEKADPVLTGTAVGSHRRPLAFSGLT